MIEDCRSEAQIPICRGYWKLDTGNLKLETGYWKFETGNWKLEI